MIGNRELILLKLQEGKRIDNRSFFDYRPIKFHFNVSENAEGSCLVELGNTKVIAGVKIDKREPFPDLPDEALLVVNAEYSPTSSYETIAGPPDINDILLARLVDRAIRSSEAIDLKKYVIEEGREVYAFHLDIIVLDNDGNALDAALLASLGALANTKVDDKKVKLERIPIYTTFGKIENYLLVDPNREEENLLNSKISIAFDEEGIVAIQKDLGEFTKEEIETIISKGEEIAKDLREMFKKEI